MILQAIWFALLFVLLAGYAVLDGYDLGVGILHLFCRGDRQRRISLNAIGPVWDGNEVWLLTGGGALFAAFPAVYATVFSGFYLALMLLLVALIARAVAIEFRSKLPSPAWRSFWDWAFSLGSILPAVLLGVAFGNILHGLPLDEQGNYTGTFFDLLNPFSLLIGVLALAACTFHGAIYLAAKTAPAPAASSSTAAPSADADALAIHNRLASATGLLFIVFALLWVLSAVASYFTSPFLFDNTFRTFEDPTFEVLSVLCLPLPWIVAVIALVAAGLFVRRRKFGRALVASSVVIVASMALAALGLYPRLVPSVPNFDRSLTVAGAASSQYTLTAMLIIALVGMPLVLVYTFFVHRIFKGPITLDNDGY